MEIGNIFYRRGDSKNGAYPHFPRTAFEKLGVRNYKDWFQKNLFGWR
jgi:hypothetical protein